MNIQKATYLFIGVITVLIILGTVVLYLVTPRKQLMTNPTSPTTSLGTNTPYIPNFNQNVTPKIPQAVLTTEEKTRIVTKLPYVGDGFVVEYYPYAGLFYVRMSAPGTNTPQYAAAVTWLKNIGVDDPAHTYDIQFTFPILRR